MDTQRVSTSLGTPCIHTYMYTPVYIHIICIHKRTHIYIYIQTYVHTYTYIILIQYTPNTHMYIIV